MAKLGFRSIIWLLLNISACVKSATRPETGLKLTWLPEGVAPPVKFVKSFPFIQIQPTRKPKQLIGARYVNDLSCFRRLKVDIRKGFNKKRNRVVRSQT